MKLLHTSDWHLGRALYGRKRYAEFEAFLNWLAGLIEAEGINVLLVAGDVFDNSVPSNHAQELYYRFLCRVAATPHRHVVVTAGNHDSPSFLNAPRELLKFLNIHVVGYASAQVEDEVILLAGPDGEPQLIVCAIPYLRDRDIRTAEAGEGKEGACLRRSTIYLPIGCCLLNFKPLSCLALRCLHINISTSVDLFLRVLAVFIMVIF